MRRYGPRVLILFLWVFLLSTADGASGAETWITDVKTGCKIGYVSTTGSTLTSATWNGPIVNGKAQGKGTFTFILHGQNGTDPVGEGRGEMSAGLLNGEASLRWANGDSYEGSWVKGLWNGKGIYKRADGSSYDGEWLNGETSGKGVYTWSNGNRYEGDWLKGVRSGEGILKDKEGKILYEGLWKDDKPVVKLKTDNVLGIPWGASQKTVESIMNQRPETKNMGKGTRKNAVQCSYTTTFNGNSATAAIFLQQDQMYWVRVILPSRTVSEATSRYDDFKQGLISRYDLPMEEKGSGSEAFTRWSLGEEHVLTLGMGKSQTGTEPPVPVVCLDYVHKPTFDLVENNGKPKKISDF